MKKLLLGNAAVARGAYEAGVKLVASYPGTPSTEITEEIVKFEEIYAEWSPNEKVACEVAHFVTGKHNLLIKIYCFDHDHLMQVLLNTIQKIPYVQQTETQISLDQAIERQVWVKEYQNTSFSASVKKNKKD